MLTETSATTGVGEEGVPSDSSGAGASKARLPAEFVYDNEQILLEVLRRRAEVEDARRFDSALRRPTARLKRPSSCS